MRVMLPAPKEIPMRKLIAVVALAGGVAALTGCVGYGGAPYGTAYCASPYYGTSPYYSGSVYIEQRGGRYYGNRDRDGDGVANRYDRDRDGDGVSNRHDSYPNDPR